MSEYRAYRYDKGPMKGAREKCLYQDENGNKYLRIQVGKTSSYKSLGTKSITEAVKLRDARTRAQVAADLGLAQAPSKTAAATTVTVRVVIERYVADGYPPKKGPRKPGVHAEEEVRYCATLLEYFNGHAPADTLTQNGLDAYHDFRVAAIKKGRLLKDGVTRGKPSGDGHRATDLELNALNSAYRWAVRKELLKTNPIEGRAKYASAPTHCREYSVESLDELHRVAGLLMSSKRSEVCGWALLIEGCSGLRSDETVPLKIGVSSQEPGGLTPDKKNMAVRRAEKSPRINPFVRVNEGLKLVLDAHKIWHSARYPNSPYYLPGRDRLALGHLGKDVLSKALLRLHKVYLEFRVTEKDPKKFPAGPYLVRKLTGHGAGRAFYIFARRCQGADDPQIAYEVNHVGGVGTLEAVYGLPAKHWRDGEAPGMSWIPATPAWESIKGVDFSALKKKPAAAPAPADEAVSFDI